MERLFEVDTPIGIKIGTTAAYWEKIINLKHPSMKGKEKEVQETLRNPQQIRRSKKDPEVILFYRPYKQYHLAVVAKISGNEGFIITAYITDTIKEGEPIWPK